MKIYSALLILSVLSSSVVAQEPELIAPELPSQSSQLGTDLGTDKLPALEPSSPTPLKKVKSISLQGVITPIETLRLATRDAGVVEHLCVTEGDRVNAGDSIAILDEALFKAELNAARNEVNVAKEETKNDVDLQYAKVTSAVNDKVYQRSEFARRQFAKSISKTELERLRLESERSRLSLIQANRQNAINQFSEELKKDKLEIARIRLENRTVRSKINGTVVELLFKPGEFVNSGQPIARILNLDRLRVVSASAPGLTPDQIPDTATFKAVIKGNVVSYPAKITFVSPEYNPVRKAFPIFAEIENIDGRLYSGFVGKLEFDSN